MILINIMTTRGLLILLCIVMDVSNNGLIMCHVDWLITQMRNYLFSSSVLVSLCNGKFYIAIPVLDQYSHLG